MQANGLDGFGDVVPKGGNSLFHLSGSFSNIKTIAMCWSYSLWTGSSKANKRLSVERIYQKKTQLEHILLRPDTYIGSTESVTQVSFNFQQQDSNHISATLFMLW